MQEPAPANTLTAEDLSADVDVVIVGAGAAGLSAAVAADEAGLNAILVEQLGIIGGSSMRAHSPAAAKSKLQAEQNVEYSVESFCEYLTAPIGDVVPAELLDEEYCIEFAKRSGSNADWLYDMGVEFGVASPNPGGGQYGQYSGRVGWSIIKELGAYLDEHGCDYRLNTKATALITENSKICGIKAEYEGVEYEIKADAVILATGGYIANKELVARFAPGYENYSYDVSVGCDGSGLLMALEAGAATKGISTLACHPFAGNYNGVSRSLTMPGHFGCIAVNEKGERFCNEAGGYADVTALVQQQEGSIFVLMDEKTMNNGAIATDKGLSNIKDMYVICDTLEELAAELGIDYEGLNKTIERYAGFVANGTDEDYGKGVSGLIGDFSEGPYYGIKTGIENHTVYGGVSIDNHGRVLTETAETIDGLYAIGEVAAFKTAGRTPLSECIDLGRVSVKTIQSELGK